MPMTYPLKIRKGSALITTIVLIGVLSVALAWTLRYAVVENRINHRYQLPSESNRNN